MRDAIASAIAARDTLNAARYTFQNDSRSPWLWILEVSPQPTLLPISQVLMLLRPLATHGYCSLIDALGFVTPFRTTGDGIRTPSTTSGVNSDDLPQIIQLAARHAAKSHAAPGISAADVCSRMNAAIVSALPTRICAALTAAVEKGNVPAAGSLLSQFNAHKEFLRRMQQPSVLRLFDTYAEPLTGTFQQYAVNPLKLLPWKRLNVLAKHAGLLDLMPKEIARAIFLHILAVKATVLHYDEPTNSSDSPDGSGGPWQWATKLVEQHRMVAAAQAAEQRLLAGATGAGRPRFGSGGVDEPQEEDGTGFFGFQGFDAILSPGGKGAPGGRDGFQKRPPTTGTMSSPLKSAGAAPEPDVDEFVSGSDPTCMLSCAEMQEYFARCADILFLEQLDAALAGEPVPRFSDPMFRERQPHDHRT
jgi:hypothetical protein